MSDISSRQNISLKYAEQIISKLVKANLLTSSRGANGGYILSKKPTECSIAEVLLATGDLSSLVPCLASPCPKSSTCEAVGCWGALNNLIYNYLSKISLQNLIDKTY